MAMRSRDAPKESARSLSLILYLGMRSVFGIDKEAARQKGAEAVIPPRRHRLVPREYDRHLYKERNLIERMFNQLKGFRRIFSRFDKLDVMFMAFLCFALVVEALR